MGEFLKEYIKNPSAVGAIKASSHSLAIKMIEDIDFIKAKTIVEYGPGTGIFTEKLISRMGDDTKLILIEYNKEFYNQLVSLYGNKKKVVIINDTAENIDKYIGNDKIDYIVSGLPFASLPKDVSDNILDKSKELLSEDGEFITFQYTLLKKDLFKRYFKEIDISRELKNLPPAYVLRCKAK